MTQTILVLIILTVGSLVYTGLRPGKQTPARAGELLGPKMYGALLALTLILVLIWR
jgi:hypothetical protein